VLLRDADLLHDVAEQGLGVLRPRCRTSKTILNQKFPFVRTVTIARPHGAAA
jgi:hypothetical protein